MQQAEESFPNKSTVSSLFKITAIINMQIFSMPRIARATAPDMVAIACICKSKNRLLYISVDFSPCVRHIL